MGPVHLHSIASGETPARPLPRVVAWEMTRRCPLACRHCRAEADNEVVREGELSTAEGKTFIDELAG